MPFDRKKYPADWEAFSNRTRFDRAGGRCECSGQCGLHPAKPEPRRCIEKHATKAMWAAGRIILTVAHLCQCDPPCADENHVIAACQRCHLRIDTALHVKNSRETRERKSGQMKLL